MIKLIRFTDDAASVSIGQFALGNGTDKVVLYGSLDLTRDKHGLTRTLALKALVDDVVRTLQAEKELPNAVPDPMAAKSVPNPFG